MFIFSHTKNTTKIHFCFLPLPSLSLSRGREKHGSHNVSRWMTWLPISLKNAAKCDKWYQLQNHSITESLNANGTWKKILVVQLQVCHDLSVEQKPRKKTRFFFRQILCLSVFSFFKRKKARCGGFNQKLYSPL